MILWTGDNVAHDIVKTAEESATATLEITKYIKDVFPRSVVYPINGNHEFAPMNLQDLTKDHDDAIDMIADVWKEWLTTDVYQFYKTHSFYSFLMEDHPKASSELKEKLKGTRIIALNGQSCYYFNFYLWSEMNDELGQLDWLEKTLKSMERFGEKAIIIGHIPPGGEDCMTSFAKRFAVLMDRYQHIVRTSLFGHVHIEFFNVVRDVKTYKPINTDIISGSLTTFTNLNPSFRIITLDQEFMVPVEIETRYINLTKANMHPTIPPRFTHLYKTTEQFNIPDLRPSNMLKYSDMLLEDEEIAKDFKSLRYARSKTTDEPCNLECRKNLHCNTAFNVYDDTMKCEKNGFFGNFLRYLFWLFPEPWIDALQDS